MAGKSRRARFQRAERAAATAAGQSDPEVTLAQVLEAVDRIMITTPADRIASEKAVWLEEVGEDGSRWGAPPEVYVDDQLLVAWLTTYHPEWICDGPAACGKEHPGLSKGTVCDGSLVNARSRTRTFAEVSHRIANGDPRHRVTLAERLAAINEMETR